MQKFFFEIRSRGFFLLVIAFLIISWLVYAEVTESFDESSILQFQSAAGNTSLDYSMWILTEIGGIIPIMIFCFVMFVWRKTRRMGSHPVVGCSGWNRSVRIFEGLCG